MEAARRIRMLSAIGLCASFVMLIGACSNSSAPATPPPLSLQAAPAGAATSEAQTSDASGEILYESQCASCHGQIGEGGKAPDGSIATPLSFHQRAHANLLDSDQQIVRSVLDGIHEEAGSNRVLGDAMPRFRDKLSEAEVTDIISYMKALP